MERRNVDELILIDVNATLEKREPLYDRIRDITKNLFCPITYCGGVRNISDIQTLIQNCGVDKVAIKTGFSVINSAAKKFGSQAIVYVADCFNMHVECTPRKFKLERWLKCIQNEGAGEILLTDMNHNGLQNGYSITLIKRAASAVSIPIIANGGGTVNSMPFAIQAGASAVAASSLFLFTDTTPYDCALALDNYGIAVRLDAAKRAQRPLGRPILEPYP